MNIRGYILRSLILYSALLVFGTSVWGQKLSAEEILSKHLASVGTPESLAKAKGRMAIGKSEFISRSPPLTSVGRAVIASDGSNYAFHSTFDLAQYPMERIGLFSNKVTIPFLKEGMRSPLGAFLLVNDQPLVQHLFGGVLLSTWRLFDVSRTDGTFETDGKKKVKDREAWVIRYRPKGGLRDGSSIKLYFDAETFRHIRTVYDLAEPDRGFYGINRDTSVEGRGTPLTSQMAQNNNVLTEDFDDFREANGLMLPHLYKVDLTLNGVSGTANFKWNFTIVEHRLVNNFGEGFFSFTV
ncbi:MAG: hypothetical protein DMF62_06470 [Acidobacteria bacterium]|nr:MAG: hypothetical protein DMF62_06470 [Acidobacteriota bacterium]